MAHYDLEHLTVISNLGLQSRIQDYNLEKKELYSRTGICSQHSNQPMRQPQCYFLSRKVHDQYCFYRFTHRKYCSCHILFYTLFFLDFHFFFKIIVLDSRLQFSVQQNFCGHKSFSDFLLRRKLKNGLHQKYLYDPNRCIIFCLKRFYFIQMI